MPDSGPEIIVPSSSNSVSKATSGSVTVIITTSPTPSAPSTDLLSAAFASFSSHCPLLLTCPVIVVFDTFDHVVEKARLKKGQVTPEGAKAYAEYKRNIQELVRSSWGLNDDECSDGGSQKNGQPPWETRTIEAEFGSDSDKRSENLVRVGVRRSPNGLVTFLEPEMRLGFALGVRSALREARTPYVWIHQHDWKLDAALPLAAMVQVMDRSRPASEGGGEDEDYEREDGDWGRDEPPVRYICLLSPRMLRYAESAHVVEFPALKRLTASLRREFVVGGGGSVPLTPLFFWHDKPHLADRRHYLARIFSTRLAVSRGMFIEDSVGHRARDQMKEGRWARWGCWLYYPRDGDEVSVRHLHGRVWKGEEVTKINMAGWQQKGRRTRETEASLQQDEVKEERACHEVT